MPADDQLLSGDLIRAVELLAEAFVGRSVRYALIGGLATLMRGRPRFTQDAGFLVDVPQIVLPGLLDHLAQAGFTLEPAVVIQEYVQDHVTSFRYGTTRIDWLKPVLPLYSRALADAEPLEWSPGHSVRTATALGLILTKLVASRPQDQVDIETLLTANRDAIDVDLIRKEWSPFADTEVERTAWLNAAIARPIPRRQ